MKIRKPIEDNDMIHKSGSDIWPSENPNDRPISDYICKHCGYMASYQACGSFPHGFPSAEEHYENAKERMIKHFGECPKWPMLEISEPKINSLILEKLDIILNLRMT